MCNVYNDNYGKVQRLSELILELKRRNIENEKSN